MCRGDDSTDRRGVLRVTWQDELRRLDEELAAGQLSAEDYRRQRDDLLSRTASRPSGATGTPPEADLHGGPFPPPFRWDQAPVESTQVMGVVRGEAGGGPDNTQVVTEQEGGQPGGQVGGLVGGQMGADAERTQVVPGRPRPPQQPGMPPGAMPSPQGPPGPQGRHRSQGPPGAPPPPWQPGGDQPPWGGMDLPPTTDTTPAWFRQGPEVFEADVGRRRGRGIFVLLAILVLLAGVAAVAVYVVRNLPGGEPAAAQTTPQATGQPSTTAAATTTAPRQLSPIEALFEKMPQPPGEQDADGGVLTLAKAADLKLLSPAEVKILRDARVEQVAYRGSIKGQDEYSPFPDVFEAVTFVTADPAAASSIAGKLRAYQEQNGLIHIPQPLPDMPPSVLFEKRVNPVRTIYRGLYVSGPNVVRLNVVQEPLKDEAALSGSYQRHMHELVTSFGPSG
jgi:hypothetical protein